MKKFNRWANKKVKKLDWIDIELIKLATAAAVIVLALLWPPLLSLDWYWYAIIILAAGLRPWYKFYFQK